MNKKTLIIGANEVGKTNFIQAIRLVLDKSLSEAELEPNDSDFNISNLSDEFRITLYFKDIKEDHILSQLKENISSEGKLVVQFVGFRKKVHESKSYHILVGPDLVNLFEADSRFYLRSFHLQYIDANRDIYSFLKREKRKLIEEGKEVRGKNEIDKDQKTLGGIQKKLGIIEKAINGLSYIKKATDKINKELTAISHTGATSVALNTNSINPEVFIDSLELASKSSGSVLAKGGEGRNNQIFLALWASKFKENSSLDETILFCVEEPEAHLHPHQQRSLARYLVSELNGQVILTSHSPQIASEFNAGSIVHLLKDSTYSTCVANGGCSTVFQKTIVDFGHRLNIIPAECYFAKVVILVEGLSEVLILKSLGSNLTNFDLDKLNISIQSVEGVGFKPYLKLFSSLKIKTVVITDNDIFQKAKSPNVIREGFNRCISFYEEYSQPTPVLSGLILAHKTWIVDGPANIVHSQHLALNSMRQEFAKIGIFINSNGLEQELLNTSMKSILLSHYGVTTVNDVLKIMRNRKAESMFDFLYKNQTAASKLKNTYLHQALLYSEKIAK